GGYSLEMIDVFNPCQGINNWIASNDLSGGTPGKKNSVAALNPDNVSPMLLSVYPQSNDTIIVYFDEEILSSTLSTTVFTIDNGIGNPIAIIVEGSIINSVTLLLSTPISSSILYTLTVSDISDCSGNIIMLGNTIQFGISEETFPGDIVINEVLFNPATGGYDYVELYNNSKKILDLSDLYIIELNMDDTSMISEFANVSVSGRLFFPGTYVLLTEDISNVAQQYNRNDISNFIAITGMPNYPDDAGVVLIQTKTFVNIDRLEYSDEWQFELLEDDDGVALERVSFSSPTQDANNWHSAAELIGYGTPGYQNSNYNAAVIADNLLHIEYSVFSPDGDGYQDLLMITYQTQAEGFVANIRIFDDAGRPLATILNNETLARKGFVTWDGVYDDGRRAPMGIYFLYAEFFNLDGIVTKQRKKFTLIRKYE
ncbi:MAG: gliding motility-associated C-terminal domain-containing protein, partial [Chitinophagales bacterium]